MYKRQVIQAAGQVKEYMRIFERAPALKAVGLEDTYKVLADFGDAVLAGQLGKKGARFVTWEWDFDRQGVHAGHYFMENYEAAKQDVYKRQAIKSARGMPWHQEPMKDVTSCDKLRGAANEL